VILLRRRCNAYWTLLVDEIVCFDECSHCLCMNFMLGPEEVENSGTKDVLFVSRLDSRAPYKWTRRRERSKVGIRRFIADLRVV
jgi:hypothetical protein